MADKRVIQELHDLRRKGREEHLKLMGVEVKKLRRLERQIDGAFAELADGVKKKLAKTGGEVAELHERSRHRTAMIAQKTAEGVISPDIAEVRPQMFCICLSHNSALQVGGCDHSTVITPPSGGTGTASTTFGATEGARRTRSWTHAVRARGRQTAPKTQFGAATHSCHP